MGKMKEKFLDERQRAEDEMQNQYLDDDYCCGQACGCHEQRMEEIEQNTVEYDVVWVNYWWNSLTDNQKEEIFNEQDASEKEYYESK